MTPDMSTLITDNMEMLRAYSRKVGKHNHEDVFQEACATVMAARTYDPSRPAGPWLYWHVRSAGARVLQGQTQHVPVGLIVANDNDATPPNQEYATDLALLCDRIDGLPANLREIVEPVMQGEKIGTVGARLGISKQAAHQRMNKARRVLGIAA